MCLAVPAQVIAIDGFTAVVDMNGVRRRANVAFLEDLRIGDYILLHAGSGIRKWSEADLAEYREIVGELPAEGPGRRAQ